MASEGMGMAVHAAPFGIRTPQIRKSLRKVPDRIGMDTLQFTPDRIQGVPDSSV